MSATMTTITAAKLTALPRPADDAGYLAAAARADQLHAAKRKAAEQLADVDAEIEAGRRALHEARRPASPAERAADAILAGTPDAQAIRTNMQGLGQRRAELAAVLEAHELACRKYQQLVSTPAFDAAAKALAPAVLVGTVHPATLAVEAAFLELGRALRHLDRVRDAVDAAGLDRAVRIDRLFTQDDLDPDVPFSAAARYLAGLREDGVLPERTPERSAERKPAGAKAGK